MNIMHNLFGGGFQLPGFLGAFTSWVPKLIQFCKNPIGSIMGMNNVKVPGNFNGTPEELVKLLMDTGQMTQEQFESFGQTANQIQNMKDMFPRF